MENKAYIDFLIERDKVKSPYKDTDCLNNNGKPITRCPVCHYILNLFTEQFCPACGQRFVDSKNKVENLSWYCKSYGRTVD